VASAVVAGGVVVVGVPVPAPGAGVAATGCSPVDEHVETAGLAVDALGSDAARGVMAVALGGGRGPREQGAEDEQCEDDYWGRA
jgi:hypothetical protein